MTYYIDIQRACQDSIPISDRQLIQWAKLSLKDHCTTGELTIRIVSTDEITELNHRYRKKNKATNVLAFPSTLPQDLPLEHPFLGDVIICPAVLLDESIRLNKPIFAHWAHIVIHGILHLLQYDHETDEETAIMQQREIELLNQLGFPNPYDVEDTHLE